MQSRGVFRAGFGILASIIFLAAGVVLPARAQVFSTPLNLSANPGISRNPNIAVDGRGNVNVVWRDNTLSNFEIFFTRSTDRGRTFSFPVNVSVSPGSSRLPKIAVDGDGNISIIWHDDTPGPFDIFFSRSTDGGLTFSAPINLSVTGGDSILSGGPHIAAGANGNINIVWREFIPSSPIVEILFTHSADGVNFSAPLILSVNAPGGVADRPRIYVDSNGNINVVWPNTTPGNRNIFFTRSTDGGQTFSFPLNLSASPGASNRPRMAIDSSGNINVVWHDTTPGNRDIFFSHSANGVIFSFPVNISSNPSNSQNPNIAVDTDGNLSVFWQDGAPGNRFIFYSGSADGGQTFSPPLNISTSTNNSGFPRLAVDRKGNINVGWHDNTPDADIFFTRSTDRGQTFSSPLNLSANPGSSTFPHLAVDSGGSINIVWTDTTPGNQDIFFSRPLDSLLQELIADVVDLNLQQGISSSLDFKLDAVLRALDDLNQNNNAAVINSLQAFINAVEAQRGVQIPEADADELVADAQAIIALLGS